MPSEPCAHTGWSRARQVLNWANGSTLVGLAVAALGGARPRPLARGVVLATGYRLRFPAAAAFTVGNVVVTRRTRAQVLARPRLLAHEERHCSQYAACLGLPMLPLYGLAAALSVLVVADPARANPFERHAGLADGGYGGALEGRWPPAARAVLGVVLVALAMAVVGRV